MTHPRTTFTEINNQLRFIDLFAGIGGFHIALSRTGARCVFASEWDKYAAKTYEANHGIKPHGDITKIEAADIPDHDILCAGFPCQSFSTAGKQLGFADTRGTMFFEIARIIKEKRPRAFILENVPNLLHHDKGKTIATILGILRNDLGYDVPDPRTLCAANFGVPQNRKRAFIVGIRNDINHDPFIYPVGEKDVSVSCPGGISAIVEAGKVPAKFFLSSQYFESLKKHRSRWAMKSKGYGYGYVILDPAGLANTLMVGGQGRERNLIKHPFSRGIDTTEKILNPEGVRNLTPREWARLQGFPEDFKIISSDTQAYKQFGNSVAIPCVQAVADSLILAISTR